MSLITPFLYLGDASNAQDANFMTAKRIKLIVNCAKEIPNYFHNSRESGSQSPLDIGIKYLTLGWDDIPQQSIKSQLNSISDSIISTIRKGQAVLVHCAMGISRSASVVIYTLMRLHQWGYEKSFAFVKDLRPQINPNSGFVSQLMEMSDTAIPREIGNAKKSKHVISNTPSNDMIEFIPQNIEPFVPMHNIDTSSMDKKTDQITFGNVPYERYINIMRDRKETPDNVPDGKNWSKLTMDCEDCDRPLYSKSGNRSYARLFV